MAPTSRALVILATAGTFTACSQGRAALDVSLSPPFVYAFAVHGNCFLGWMIRSEFTVAETRGMDVTIESLSFRVEDRAGTLLGWNRVDGDVLVVGFPEAGAALPGHSQRTLSMEVNVGGPVARPPIDIVMSVEVVAADREGRVGTTSRAPATVTFPDPHLAQSGPCRQTGV